MRRFIRMRTSFPRHLETARFFRTRNATTAIKKPGSQLEDDLAKFLSLPRVMTRFSGRKGPPKLKKPGHKSYLKARPDDNLIYIHQPDETEDSIDFVDNGNGTATLNVPIPKHRAANVARALARMALFILPADFKYHDNLRSWVNGAQDWFPIPLTAVHVPGSAFNRVQISVERYSPLPDRYILRVGFMYSSYFLFMPIPVDNWIMPHSGVPMLNYNGIPPHIALAMMQNTSEFLIPDNEPDETGMSSFLITYEQSRTRRKGEEKAEL